MIKKLQPAAGNKSVNHFLTGKSENTLLLYHHFIQTFKNIGAVSLHPTKTMIGIATPQRRIAWITQLGKNFVHIVFPFSKPYNDNLCFQKIAQVPGDDKQFNHHFRMYATEDVNEEVQSFMRLAYEGEEKL